MTPRRAALALLAAVSVLPLAATADWRSWLHGDPPAPPKAPPPKQVAEVTAATESARDAQVEAFLRALADAIKARDGKPMLGRLSDKYAIDGLPDRSKAAEVFVQAVESIPGPTQFAVQSIERHATGVNARVEVRYASAPPKPKTFRFDTAGRLIASDLFSIKVHSHGS
jgi:hypothetical protein